MYCELNNTKAIVLRGLDVQNLTAQNVFTKTETSGVYTKLESDARYAPSDNSNPNTGFYTRNESDFLYARTLDVYDKVESDAFYYRKHEVCARTALYNATE